MGLGYVWKRKRMPKKFLLVNLKKKTLRRSLSSWENNVEMDPKGAGWECVNFVHGSGEGWLVCFAKLALKKLHKTGELK